MDNPFNNEPVTRPESLTNEQELFIVYEYLLEAYECVSNDSSLAQFVESASTDLTQFQENYPEIVEEYNFIKGCQND